MRKTAVFSTALLSACLGLLLAGGSLLFAGAGIPPTTRTAGLAKPDARPPGAPESTAGQRALRFSPPALEEAPEELRAAVMYGHQILTQTRKTLPQHVGSQLDCKNCHFDGGMTRDGLTLVGVAAVYPKYQQRAGYAVDLVQRTNACFERSENGAALPPDGREMQAIMAYYHWISKGIPIYADVPWLGLKPVEATEPVTAVIGEQVFAAQCQACHGADGQGTKIAPPLWGDGSFNDGAGMAHVDTAAAFVHAFMPRNYPDLTDQQAVDVAAFVTSKPRPHFRGGSAGGDARGGVQPGKD
jgi:thiosulfate dehydrogenase